MDLINPLPHHDIVFPMIFSHLSVEELFKLRRVSRSYYALVEEYFKRCPKIDLTKLSKKVTAEAFVLMTHENKLIQSLLLAEATHWLVDDLFVPVVSNCCSLTCVDLSHCSQLTNHSLYELACHCHLLVNISLKGCHWVDKDNFKLLVGNNHKLTDVDVSSCWSLDDDCIMFTSEQCTGLTCLRISNIYAITDEALRSLASLCSGLEKLSISGCWRVTNNGIRSVGEYCKNLQELEVADCRDVTEASLARLRVRGVNVDVPSAPLSTLRRLEHTFHYVRPYVNLQI